MDISCSILDSPTHYSTIPLTSSNMVDKYSMILSYALKSIDINKAMSAIRIEYIILAIFLTWITTLITTVSLCTWLYFAYLAPAHTQGTPKQSKAVPKRWGTGK